jgi:hypothetical protein
MSRYCLVDQHVPAMWCSLAAARLMAELSSVKAPTTRMRLRISRTMRADCWSNALPAGLEKELGSALRPANASVGDDQRTLSFAPFLRRTSR